MSKDIKKQVSNMKIRTHINTVLVIEKNVFELKFSLRIFLLLLSNIPSVCRFVESFIIISFIDIPFQSVCR